MGSSQERVYISSVRKSSKHPESHLCRRRSQLHKPRCSSGTSTLCGTRTEVGSAGLMIRTSSPVQNMGHLFHGVSLASPSHVLRYGFLTVRGKTGGVSFEAPTERLRTAEPAARVMASQCILIYTTSLLSKDFGYRIYIS